MPHVYSKCNRPAKIVISNTRRQKADASRGPFLSRAAEDETRRAAAAPSSLATPAERWRLPPPSSAPPTSPALRQGGRCRDPLQRWRLVLGAGLIDEVVVVLRVQIAAWRADGDAKKDDVHLRGEDLGHVPNGGTPCLRDVDGEEGGAWRVKASRPLIRVLVINDNGLWINDFI